MIETTNLSFENVLVLNLVQAMLGAITPAFRAAAVGILDDKIEITIVLFEENEEAKEEIEDIAFQFDALQVEPKPIKLSVTVIPESQTLDIAKISGRLVFLRK